MREVFNDLLILSDILYFFLYLCYFLTDWEIFDQSYGSVTTSVYVTTVSL